jgi:hypothetical protein
MAQNLRRGLYRTWVFLSVLWILGASIGAAVLLQEEIGLLRRDAPEAPELIRCTDETDDALRPLCELQKELQARLREFDRPQYLEDRDAAWRSVGWAALAVFGPPVVGFCLLAGAFWVIRGFG